jgi:predicted ATPase
MMQRLGQPVPEFFSEYADAAGATEATAGKRIIFGYGGTSLHEQSHGEGFMSLMLFRFRGNGLYILDEPEAALSPARQLLMLRRIHELVMAGSQFIIATHSPIIMAYPDATIYVCEKDGDITPTPFERTEHYLLTKRFLSDPASLMQQVLDETEPASKAMKIEKKRKSKPT